MAEPNNRLSPFDRYHRDSMFRHLVDSLYLQIEAATYTPTEIREAAMVAQTKYEERRPYRISIFAGPFLPMTVCNHANEHPRGICDCPHNCGCREFMCRA